MAARRVVTLRDGRIVEDRSVTSAAREALEALRATRLGRLIRGGAWAPVTPSRRVSEAAGFWE